MNRYTWGGPEDGTRSPGTGVMEVSEPPDISTRNQTGVLYKSSMCSQLLTHVPSLTNTIIKYFTT